MVGLGVERFLAVRHRVRDRQRPATTTHDHEYECQNHGIQRPAETLSPFLAGTVGGSRRRRIQSSGAESFSPKASWCGGVSARLSPLLCVFHLLRFECSPHTKRARLFPRTLFSRETTGFKRTRVHISRLGIFTGSYSRPGPRKHTQTLPARPSSSDPYEPTRRDGCDRVGLSLAAAGSNSYSYRPSPLALARGVRRRSRELDLHAGFLSSAPYAVPQQLARKALLRRPRAVP